MPQVFFKLDQQAILCWVVKGSKTYSRLHCWLTFSTRFYMTSHACHYDHASDPQDVTRWVPFSAPCPFPFLSLSFDTSRQDSIAQHSTAQHIIAQLSTAQHSTAHHDLLWLFLPSGGFRSTWHSILSYRFKSIKETLDIVQNVGMGWFSGHGKWFIRRFE